MNTMKASRTLSRHDACFRATRQQGAVLFIALIVLVSMMLASIALIRSADTANVIAGNLAFKQATLQAGDFGVEAAATALPNIAATPDATVTPAATGTPTYWYYATRRNTDANGIPTTGEAGIAAGTAIDWVNNVPISTTVAGNDVRIVIDRLCRGDGTGAVITDLAGRCFNEAIAGGCSNVIGTPCFATVSAVFYRVTAHVTGPRNTVSVVQAIVSR